MRGIYVLPLKDAEKGRQRRSRIPQRLTVRPGQTPVHTGDGWAGENRVRFASSLATALPVERRVLARQWWAGENCRLFAHPAWQFGVVSNLDIRDGDRGRNEFFRSLLELRLWPFRRSDD